MTSNATAVVSLPSDTQILITRDFDAPRKLVYRAFTEPDLIARWWSAGHGETTLVEADLRDGGAWRRVMVTPVGFEVAFRGEFREVVANERVVHTEIYEAMPDEQALVTNTFTGTGPRTTLTILIEHASTATRDLHVESGMESGLQQGLRSLEQIARACVDRRLVGYRLQQAATGCDRLRLTAL